MQSDTSIAETTLTQGSINHDPKENDKNNQGDNSISETVDANEDYGNNHDDALLNTSPPIVTVDGEVHKETNELTVNNDEDENRPKKTFHSKVKYASIPYHRSSYYTNGHPYETVPYYYYSLPSLEKPAPLMFLPTPSTTSKSPSPSSRETQNGGATTVPSQNLPPRLRQTSATEIESNSQVTSTNSQTSVPATATHTNSRRHRSILPRGLSNYYAAHPPPPLMATPPGVLYPYPPTVHQAGHIAYNIRTPDELELYAFQQQMMGLPPTPIIWPSLPNALPPHGHPSFAHYATNEIPPAYLFNSTTVSQPANSFLNPDAAEWIPTQNGHDSSSDQQILIDDEINFPPLNSTATNTQSVCPKDSGSDTGSEHNNDVSSEITPSNTNESNDTPIIETDNSNAANSSNPKPESPTNSSSSQEDDNSNNINNHKPLSSPIKVAPVTYSTIISQTSDNQKANKTPTNNQQQQARQQPSTNHTHNQLPPRERANKQQQQQQQQRSIVNSSPSPNTNSRRRPPYHNNNRIPTRNLLPTDANALSKQQQQQQQQPTIADDWIEVKSKKTKRFDRNLNDSSTEKFLIDEQIHKSVSPSLSLTSTGDNTTGTFTSEDDYDEKDNQDLVIILDNNVPNDYNQIIVDDIHNRLDNHEQLLIIMRGCPGSGKSTLAKSLNHGYSGVILSTDDYFTDRNLNKYVYDLNKLDDAHRYNRRRASDALKRQVTPVIIDNTNTQTWEMKPYVAMGKEAGYSILLVEPQTPWRYKARELFKRNRHNVPLKRIRDMLTRFEHSVTVQSILDQLASTMKQTNVPLSEQNNQQKDVEILDSVSTSKKFYDTIDDSLILDDVRLCIDDMILFLTSNFYQTTLLSSSLTLPTTTVTTGTTSPTSTPLSVSFHDLSLISSSPTTASLPSTPSTPHSRFHRPLTRFPSTTNQDHSYNTEHLLRLPTGTSAAFGRCFDAMNLTPPLSAQSSLLAKKRRKNKSKPSPNELVLNTNNNNNNQMAVDRDCFFQQQNFQVFLPDDCLDCVVIDEHDWIDPQNGLLRDHSSTISYKQTQLSTSDNTQLINVLQSDFHEPSMPRKHVSIQCLSSDIRSDSSGVIRIGRLPSSMPVLMTPSMSPLAGYSDCSVQVDMNATQLEKLIETYSNRLSGESIQQFYELCHENLQWTRSHIDGYLQQNQFNLIQVPTLHQMCLNILHQWDEQIKSHDPSFDSKSLDDLLQDINDNEILDDLPTDDTNIRLTESNRLHVPWSIINLLEQLYGELPNKSIFTSDASNVLLPCDDELSRYIYQTLQRFSNQSDEVKQSTIEKKKKATKINSNDQKWKVPSSDQISTDVQTSHIPSLKQIMNEQQRQQTANAEKSKQKQQLDYATEYKLKELVRLFPSFDTDLLHDLLRENEYNYDTTFICISTMLGDQAFLTDVSQPSQTMPACRSISTNKHLIEPVNESYEILRCDALQHGQRRKEFYAKAQQAYHHGMSGVASYYIHRASEETQLMKEANRTACERLSQWRLKQFYQTHQLDLHGLHSDEALNLFKQIECELNSNAPRTTPKSIEIITGYGKNSIYGGIGYGKIRSVLLTYIQQRNYKYSEPNKGVILLQLTNAKSS
ncbi:unnamed protein product [Adineta ricciae]|uniref:Smr domain-containing protein n=1 Tax=Adineta ricciae TaxID=249248 RepID=A0A816CR01_ADIRI|nr:unnamed protein product [Adineta ricciae]